MRRIATLAAIFLLLTTVAPVLACVTGVGMSREETACCRAMHGQCGEMVKMSCCQTKARADIHPQIVSAPPSTDLLLSPMMGVLRVRVQFIWF
jgi:hypothetical protein